MSATIIDGKRVAADLRAELAAEVADLLSRGVTPGLGVLLVEHHTDFVFRVCDRVTALDVGKTIRHGTPDEVRNDPEVIRVYLGA